MKIQKLCLFTSHFFPNIGGIERYVYHMAEELVNQNYPTMVVTFKLFPDTLDYEVMDDVRIIRLPCLNIFSNRYPIPLPSLKFFKLLKEVNKFKPDVTILNTRFFLSTLIGGITSKINKSLCILIEHGSGHFTVNNQLFDFLGHIYEHIISKISTVFVDAYFGVSTSCTNWLQHFNIQAHGVIYNGIKVGRTKAPEKRFVESISIASSEKVVISFGARLIKEKGVYILLDAFENILPFNPNIQLFIAGDGPLYKEISQKYSNHSNIKILGKLNYDEMMWLLSKTDIVAFPTYFPEGLPTIILEAALFKCAVISTPMGGTKEVINSDKFGILIEPNSTKELEDALLCYISDEKYRNLASDNLHKKVIANYTWKNIIRNFILNLERIINYGEKN